MFKPMPTNFRIFTVTDQEINVLVIGGIMIVVTVSLEAFENACLSFKSSKSDSSEDDTLQDIW